MRVETTAAPMPLQTLAGELRHDVEALCARGPRNTLNAESLRAAAAYLEGALAAAGYLVQRQTYVTQLDGVAVHNLAVEIEGTREPREVVVVGAHYDTVPGSPGADDNASGSAALVALARRMRDAQPARTLRFVAFVNEEPPHFQSNDMGSWQYARACRERGERVVGMLSLEMLGYYADGHRSQQYPAALTAFYPKSGNFVGIVANFRSRALAARVARAYRGRATVPARVAVLPRFIPQTAWSDQWSFWELGWPAVMITDTAMFRNPHYHAESDTPETLDYDRMAQVVEGLDDAVRELAG